MGHAGQKYLIFKLYDEYYGVSVDITKEVIKMTEIAEVPKAPPFVKGVINLRGKIIPAIELRKKFGIVQKEYDDKTCIIIIEIEGDETSRLMGVIVDTVIEVAGIYEQDINSPPEFNDNSQMEFLCGVSKFKDNVLWLLNLDKIISHDELVILNKINEEI